MAMCELVGRRQISLQEIGKEGASPVYVGCCGSYGSKAQRHQAMQTRDKNATNRPTFWVGNPRSAIPEIRDPWDPPPTSRGPQMLQAALASGSVCGHAVSSGHPRRDAIVRCKFRRLDCLPLLLQPSLLCLAGATAERGIRYLSWLNQGEPGSLNILERRHWADISFLMGPSNVPYGESVKQDGGANGFAPPMPPL